MKNNHKTSAVTMVELVIAMAITAIIATGAMILHRNSVKITSAGMANVEMMREANSILKTIRNDLKHACFPYQGTFTLSFDDIVQLEFSKTKGLEGAEFSFFRFAAKPEFASLGYYKKDYLIKTLTKITYRLEKIEKSDLLKLIREVTEYKQQPKQQVLTERVGFFNIKPIEIKTETTDRKLWTVSLQLSQKTDLHSTSLRGENCLHFYDVVSSDFYHSLAIAPNATRNWNTGLIFSVK